MTPMQSPDDLPPFADQFRPRWPGDVGGYTAEQMRAQRARGVAEAADMLWLTRAEASLMAGEMTLAQWQTVAAVLAGLRAKLRTSAAIRAGHATS
jgi:hypothetical protein